MANCSNEEVYDGISLIIGKPETENLQVNLKKFDLLLADVFTDDNPVFKVFEKTELIDGAVIRIASILTEEKNTTNDLLKKLAYAKNINKTIKESKFKDVRFKTYDLAEHYLVKNNKIGKDWKVNIKATPKGYKITSVAIDSNDVSKYYKYIDGSFIRKQKELESQRKKSTIEDIEKDEIVKDYVSKLTEKFGIEIATVSGESVKEKYKNLKGWYVPSENKVYLNTDKITLDTLFHEVFHPLLEVIKRDNQELYINLVKEIKNKDNESLLKEVKEKYPELSPQEIIDEAIVTLTGYEASNTLEEKVKNINKKDTSKSLMEKIRELFDSFKLLISKIQETNKDYKEGDDVSVKDLTNFTIKDLGDFMLTDIKMKDAFSVDDNLVFFDTDMKDITHKVLNGDINEYLISMSKNLDQDGTSTESSDYKSIQEDIDTLMDESDIIDKKTGVKGVGTTATRFVSELEDKNFDVDEMSEMLERVDSFSSNEFSSLSYNEKQEAKNRLFNERIVAERFIKFEFSELNKGDLTSYYKLKRDKPEFFQEKVNAAKFHPEFNKGVRDYEASVLFAKNIGTSIHENVSEKFFNSIQKIKDEKGNITESDIDNFVFDTINMIENESAYFEEDVLMVKKDASEEIKERFELLKGFKGVILEVEKNYKGKNPRYVAELNINSDKLKLYGKADLVVFFDNKEFLTVDIKTKTSKDSKDLDIAFKEKWLSSFNNKLKGEFSMLPSNGVNKTSIQTSIYSLGLQEKGFKNIGNKAIYVEVVREKNEDKDTKMKDPYIVKRTRVRKNEIKNSFFMDLFDFRNEVLNELEKTNPGIKKEMYTSSKDEEGKLNNINDLMTEITGGIALDDNYTRQSARVVVLDSTENKGPNDEDGFYSKTEFNDYGDDKFIPYESSNKEDRVNQVFDYYSGNNKKKVSLVNSMINIFNGNFESVSGVSDVYDVPKITELLKGYSNETHTISRISSYPGLEDLDYPILVLTNKFSGDVSLIYLSPSSDRNINLDDLGERNSIYGTFLSDRASKSLKDLKDKSLLRATSNNFRSMLLGMVAMKLKDNNSNVKIDRAYISNGTSSKATIQVLDLRTILNPLKIFKTHQTKEKAGYLKDLFDKEYLFDHSEYEVDQLKSFSDYLWNVKYLSKNDKSEFIDALESFKEGMTDRDIIIGHFMKMQRRLSNHLAKQKINTEDSPEYKLLLRAITATANFQNEILSRKKVNILAKQWSIEANIPIHIRQRADNIISENDRVIKRNVDAFKEKHYNLLDAIAKENNTSYKSAIFNGSLLSLYTNMYANPEFNYEERDDIMKLKNPEDSSLTEAEKEYIIFFNENIANSLSLINDKKKPPFGGWVPVYSITDNSKRFHRTKGILPKYRPSKIEDTAVQDQVYNIDSKLIYLLNDHDNLKGVDEETLQKREGFEWTEKIETNLEYILNKTVVESFEHKFHSETLFLLDSIRTSLKLSSYLYSGNEEEVQDIINSLDTLVEHKVLQNRKKTDSEKILGKVSKSATTLAIISTRQVVMDSLTYGLSSTAMATSNYLYKVFGGDTEIPGYFSMGDWVKAGTLVLRNDPVSRRLMSEYGLETTDSKNMKSTESTKTMSTAFADAAFSPQKGMMVGTHAQIFIASMISDGSFDAYSVDEDTGKLVYYETKDNRFYDKDGNLVNKPYLLAIKKQMVKDGTNGLEPFAEDDITEKANSLFERKLTRGYTSVEVLNIRGNSIKMLGLFDKDGRSRIQRHEAMKQLLKFKTWIVSKKDLYIMPHDGNSDTYAQWKKIENADGTFSYAVEYTEQEGIFQSLGAIGNKLRAYAQKDADGIDLSDLEKKNLAILASHLAAFTLIYSIIQGIGMTCDKDSEGKNKKGCWLTTTSYGKSTTSLLSNVKGDLFVVIGAWEMFMGNGSMFPGISVIYNAFKRLLASVFNMAFDDETLALESSKEFMKKSWAVYRSAVEINEIAVDALELNEDDYMVF